MKRNTTELSLRPLIDKLSPPNLTGYGYTKADQDGYDGEIVTPEEHKEEEFFEALKQLLDAKPKQNPTDGESH